MSKHHILKIWPDYYDQVASGFLKHQLRDDDRGFNSGDTVELCKYDQRGFFLAANPNLHFKIGAIMRLSTAPSSCVFTLLPIEAALSARAPKPSVREIAGRLLFEASGGALNDSGTFRRWERWGTSDSKELFSAAGEKFAKDLGRASLAALDEGGAA